MNKVWDKIVGLAALLALILIALLVVALVVGLLWSFVASDAWKWAAAAVVVLVFASAWSRVRA